MEIDFSQDFARWTAEVAASPLQLRSVRGVRGRPKLQEFPLMGLGVICL